ncbi:MAG: hypothetical protein EHM79_10720 [Geobacter sp.]|nr:MAG: hypothetical protein EHM79_10720 [Geobacter sp.]
MIPLLDQDNPYRSGLPEQLRLSWDDFRFHVSPANLQSVGKEADWLVVAYMAADCNLAEYMFDDLMEMKAVGSDAALHICVLFDGPLLTDSFFARLNRGTKLSDDIIIRFSELQTSKQLTLTMALQLAASFPAKRRLLFLSGHGDGWKGALLDQDIGLEQYHNQAGRLILPGPGAECDALLHRCQLEAQEQINKRLNLEESSSPRGFDILAFDACYMGNIEAVASFVEHAGIMIVSEDQMPGDGYPYERVLSQLRNNLSQSSPDLAASLVNETKRFYQSPGAPRRKVTQVALRTERFPAFADSFVQLVRGLIPAMTDDAVFRAVCYALEKAWRLGSTGNIDLKGFLLKLLDCSLPAELRGETKVVLEKWADMVLVSAVPGQPDTANGLSIYAPPPHQFKTSYLALSNQLPNGLGLWTWLLGFCTVTTLGAGTPGHPLVQAIQRTMEDMISRGEYNPAQPDRTVD